MAESLIINSPYDPPGQHWQQAGDRTLSLILARRPAGYEISTYHVKQRLDS